MAGTPHNPYAAPAAAIDLPVPAGIPPFVGAVPTLRAASELYFSSFPTIAGIALIVGLPTELIRSALPGWPEEFLSLPVVWLLSGTVISASIIRAVDHREREGTAMHPVAAVRAGLVAWAELASARLRAVVRVILGFSLVFPGLLFLVRLSLVDPIAVLEARRSTNDVLDASEALVEGNGASVVAVRFLAFVAGVFPMSLVTGVLMLTDPKFPGLSSGVRILDDIVGAFSTVAMFALYKGLSQRQWGAQVPATENVD